MASNGERGAIQRCPECGGSSWSLWSRVPLEVLPQLVPILDDLDAWRLRDAILTELTCLRCLEFAYAYRAPSPTESRAG